MLENTILKSKLQWILAVGAASSIQEIEQEGINLTLCHCCQQTIEVAHSNLGNYTKIEIPTPADRINRVIRFMDNYLPRVDVQVAALNAIIKFARNADAPNSTRNTDVIPIVAKSFAQHIEVQSIVWRACVIFATLASYTGEIALEVALTNVHENAIDKFSAYDNEPVVQQQILWLLAALLEWPRPQRVIHKSSKCMDFFKKIGQEEEERKKALITEVISEPPPPVKNKKGIWLKVNALTANLAAQTIDSVDTDKKIATVTPLAMRTFIRETEGRTCIEQKQMVY